MDCFAFGFQYSKEGTWSIFWCLVRSQIVMGEKSRLYAGCLFSHCISFCDVKSCSATNFVALVRTRGSSESAINEKANCNDNKNFTTKEGENYISGRVGITVTCPSLLSPCNISKHVRHMIIGDSPANSSSTVTIEPGSRSHIRHLGPIRRERKVVNG